MIKLIDEIKSLKKQYLNERMTDDEAIKKISEELNISVMLVKILYYI